MASLGHHLLSEDGGVAISHVASYELHISDACLSMACYYNQDMGAPLFAAIFEDQAEVKRERAKQFLRYLRKHEGQVCLPMIKRTDIDNWGTGVQVLESALEQENELTNLLLNLKNMASANEETDLLHFMGKYLDKQKRSTRCLEHQLVYHKGLEKRAQEEDPFTQPAQVSGKETDV